jgi:hypothetical protein
VQERGREAAVEAGGGRVLCCCRTGQGFQPFRVQVEGLELEEKRRACGVFWRGSGKGKSERERDARTHSGRLGCGSGRRDAVATERKGFQGLGFRWRG